MTLSQIIKRNDILLALPFVISALSFSIPYRIPLFSTSVLLLFIFCLLNYKIDTFFIEKTILKRLFPFFCVYLITIIPILYRYIFEQKMFGLEQSYLIRSTVSIIYIFILVHALKYFLEWKDRFYNYLFYAFSVVAIISLAKYVSTFWNYTFFSYAFTGFKTLQWNYYTTTLTEDYNMFSFGMIIGLIAFHLKMHKYKKDYLFLLLIVTAIIFSGSRRGAIFIILYSVLGTAWSIYKCRFGKALIYAVPLSCLACYMMLVSGRFLNVNLSHLRINQKKFVTYFSCPAYRYFTIYDQNTNLETLRENISRQFFSHEPIRFFGNNDSTETLSNESMAQEEDDEIIKNSLDFSPSDGSRIKLWSRAIDAWFNEYSFAEKIFGRGFWYHDGVKLGIESPHNPLLSILLYGGCVGVFFLAWLLAQSFLAYWKTYRTNLFFFFLLCLLFMGISADTIFDSQFFTLILILPSLINDKYKALAQI